MLRRCWFAVAVVAVTWPTAALACGGCFSPPSGGPSAVKQAGERVLFVADPQHNKTRVWIEIRYTGPASDFAWVLPLPKVPKVGVGASWLFDRLDLATLPQFEVSQGADENCSIWTPPPRKADADKTQTVAAPPRPESANGRGDSGCGGGLASSSGGYGVSGGPALTNPSDNGPAPVGHGGAKVGGKLVGNAAVHVTAHDQTGPYDYVVVDGKEPTALAKWLTTNGYAVPDRALPIIAAHVAKGDVFLAVKLSNGSTAQEIKPLALEMPGSEACLPLRLTSLAAVDDTSVVVLVAGPGRAMPKNTPHVVINPLKLNWFGGASNYQQVLAAAIDEAGGHAFSTEFSGPVSALQVPNTLRVAARKAQYGNQRGLYDPGEALATPQTALQQMQAVKTMNQLAAALLELKIPIDAKTAPLVEGVVGLAAALGREDVAQVYLDLVSGKLMLQPAQAGIVVNGVALAAQLAPWLGGNDADIAAIKSINAAIGTQPTLTRLALFISPDEMDRDPLFVFDAKLPAVNNLHTAMANAACDDGYYPENQARLTLAGFGKWLFAYSPGSPPNNATDKRFKALPAALVVEVLDETGQTSKIAPDQVELVDAAVLGAKPGAPSLPPELVLHAAKAVAPPPSDPPLVGKLKGAGALIPRSPVGAVATLLWLALSAVALRRFGVVVAVQVKR